MSALTDRILAEHPWRGGESDGIRCGCGIKTPDRAFGWTEHIAEVTEAAVRAENEAAQPAEDMSPLAILKRRMDIAQGAILGSRLDAIEKRLEALGNTPSVAVEPSEGQGEGEGMPETAEANSGAREGFICKVHGVVCCHPTKAQTRIEGQGHRHTRLTDTPDNGDITKPAPMAELHKVLAEEPWGTKQDYTCAGCGRAIPCRHCPEDTPSLAQAVAQVHETAQQFASVTATPPVMVEAPKPGDVLTVEQLGSLPIGAFVADRGRDGWIRHVDLTWRCTVPHAHLTTVEVDNDWGPTTLVSLPGPEPDDEPADEPASTWKPLWRISREEAEGLPDGSVLRAVWLDHVTVVERIGGKWWAPASTMAQALLNEPFTLLWHPEWAEVTG